MYRLCVPVMLNSHNKRGREEIARHLRECSADTVMLVFNRVLCNDELLAETAREFCENKTYFESKGFRVSAWLAPTIGYGGPSSSDGDAPNRYTHIISDKGKDCTGAYCPLDENFVADFLNTLGAVIDTGVEEIMFEDDYTLGGGKMFRESGCLCHRHRKLLAERTGEDLDFEEMHKRLYGGKTNEYRKAFLALQRETLLEFTQKIEKFAHAKNPTLRLGLSANASSYNIEGATFAELVRATAGNTRPFVRMTGAPYWDQIPSLAANIESIRLQCHWLEDTGAELWTEGDTYPRPRCVIPSAWLEGYDMALRASGGSHGILKYMSEYQSLQSYETGYFDRHARNLPHYAEIERRFAKGQGTGLNIVEYTSLFENQDLCTDVTADTLYGYGGYLPLVSQWFATECSIPVTYGRAGDEPSLIFGENARYAGERELSRGAILDAAAARILAERGIDVGFESYEKIDAPTVEYFKEYNDFATAICQRGSKWYSFRLKKGAEVLSEHPVLDGAGFGNYSEDLWATAPRISGTYRYENANGQRFTVFPFIAETAWGKGVWRKGAFKGYYRQRQLAEACEWVARRPLPAVCLGNPGAYIICKRNENGGLTVGLWNFFADEIISPEILLDREYSRADIYRNSGHIEGRRLLLDRDIPPYGFVFFTVN